MNALGDINVTVTYQNCDLWKPVGKLGFGYIYITLGSVVLESRPVVIPLPKCTVATGMELVKFPHVFLVQ